MSILGAIQILSAVAGVATAILVVLFRRFGPASWLLSLFLVSGSLSAGVLALSSFPSGWTDERVVRLCFALLVAAAPLGAFVSYTIHREDGLGYFRERRVYTVLLILPAVFLIASLYTLGGQTPLLVDMQPGDVAVGPAGYLSGVYLLLVSVIVLGNLEQTLRSAQEHVRWEIKFLLLGLAGTFGAILYIGSRVLLYAPTFGLLSLSSLQLFPVIFLFACPLILVSWKRSSGHGRVMVSQGLIYSTITLLGVGIYLIASSIVARLAGQWRDIGVPIEAALFLLSLLVLAIFLLWTDLRHRARRWIRRHLLAGTYDYRQYWLQSSERIQSIDPPETAADALVDLVHKAVGAINVSVWLRVQDPTRLKLLAAQGEIPVPLGSEVVGVVEKFFDVSQPVAPAEVDGGLPEGALATFVGQTQASILVPLLSGGRVVGLLTVGSDRSGQPYDWETLEFLGVLAKHAAGELHKMELLSTLVEAKETEAFRTFSTFLLHDLKNFASALSLIAKNSSRHQDNPDFQRDAFRSVFETAEKMKRLCNSLRTFSTTLAVNRKLDNLSQIARGVADSYSVELGGRLALDLADVPPVLVDGEEIARVIQNLLLNAREAISPEGAITLRTRIQGSQIELSVEDNGRGMTREFVERELFLPFHTTKSDGLGIGLFQTKKIVDAHAGTIRVESEAGKGTIVRIFFPVAQPAAVEKAGAKVAG